MIRRVEKYQYNWKPKYNSKDDLELIQEIENIRKKLGIKKSEFLRMALTNLVIGFKDEEWLEDESELQRD